MSDHFDWNRPGLGDEEETGEQDPGRNGPELGAGDEPGEGGFGWNRPRLGDEDESGEQDDRVGREVVGGWPTEDPPGRPEYRYASGEVLTDEARAERFPDRRTRDPLGRLFPGLPRGLRVALDWVLTIAGAVLIVFALKLWVVNPYRIPSSSMEPTLNCAKPAIGCLGDSSDRVLACRICLAFGRAPSRGDIVVFNTPREAALKCGEGGTFVKRVIGLPGETVREDDAGFIWIRGPDSSNWVKLQEPYLTAQRRLADSSHFGQEWHVPKDSYFMMGDNRAESCDSRSWGSVPRNKLIGTVFFVYWPPDRIGFK